MYDTHLAGGITADWTLIDTPGIPATASPLRQAQLLYNAAALVTLAKTFILNPTGHTLAQLDDRLQRLPIPHAEPPTDPTLFFFVHASHQFHYLATWANPHGDLHLDDDARYALIGFALRCGEKNPFERAAWACPTPIPPSIDPPPGPLPF